MTSSTGGTFGQQGAQGGINQQQSMGQSMGRARTGASDPTYDLVSILYHCLESAYTCEQYVQDAQGDQELAQFFQQCVQSNRQGAEKAKQLLARRLSASTSGH